MSVGIHNGNVSDKERKLVEALRNTISFGKLFLPDDFKRSATPTFHYHVAEVQDNPDKQNILVCLPRGHGKTVLTKANILRTFLGKDVLPEITVDFHFYVWLAATQSQSYLNLDYIKGHIEENERIKYYFGNQRGKIWNKEDIELKNGCKLLSKSNVSGLRGMAKGHMRPTKIIADDFEDENNTKTDTSREQVRNIITAVLQPALDPDIGILQLNGTPVHHDAFIVRLLNEYESHKKNGTLDKFMWEVVTYKTTVDDPLWPSYQGTKKLKNKRQFYLDSQMPAKWYQEYEMMVQSPDDRSFTEDHIRYWDGSLYFKNDEPHLHITSIDGASVDKHLPVFTFVGADTATDVRSMESDPTVIIGIALDEHNNTYVLQYTRERGMPIKKLEGDFGDDRIGIVDMLFEYHKMYKAKMYSIEDVGISKGIFPALKEEKRRRNDFTMNVRHAKPEGKEKLSRIYSIISGRFAMRTVFLKKNMNAFVQELMTFGPRMASDDVLDAFAYALDKAYPPSAQKQIESSNKVEPFWYEKQNKNTEQTDSWITVG